MLDSDLRFGVVGHSDLFDLSPFQDECTLAPDVGKPLQKWLRRQNELPVVVFFICDENSEELLQALDYFRLQVGNRSTRLVCFACPQVMAELLPRMASHEIHRLQSSNDYQPEFLDYLIRAETGCFNNLMLHRGHRETELELMTWLARFSRSEGLSMDIQVELLNIIARIAGAYIGLLLDEQGHVLHRYTSKDYHPVEGNWSEQWPEVVQQLSLNGQDQRPMRIELDHQQAGLQLASKLTGTAICASLYLPVRCYKHLHGGLLYLVASDRLAKMDVGDINILEKSMDQLRGTLERQQAESRLQEQYARMQLTLKRLRQTQEQLFHAEKMSSIGELAAGIAHEINNPISFVMSNFEPLDDYIRIMAELLKLHDQFAHIIDQSEEQHLHAMQRQLKAARDNADLDFMLDDIHSLVQESRSGLSRVCDIVTSLRTFARKDHLSLEHGDLVKCIRDSLALIRADLGMKICIKDRMPDHARMVFNPGLMSQVFMNILQNAIKAMPEGGDIHISLDQVNDDWEIRIRDTGCGIPEDIISKIFDPFFTTRPVGSGTGLGLSTAYSIIQRHRGSISAQSKPGKGTLFIIKLPVSLQSEPGKNG